MPNVNDPAQLSRRVPPGPYFLIRHYSTDVKPIRFSSKIGA